MSEFTKTTVRVEKETLAKLKIAVGYQKLEGKKPDTAGDIVVEAIEDWFEKNSYTFSQK